MSNIGSAAVGKMTSTGRVTSKVGQLLQEARRQRGLEIKDIAASTHVRSEYLLALEEGRFSELPENVYTRNFLRLYAEAVGLDEKEVLEHYSLERYGKSDAPRKSVYPSPAYDTETESFKSADESATDAVAKKRRGIGWIAPLIVLALLGLGTYVGWRNYVFPNEQTGGYTATIPGINREFNIPSFNRSGTTTSDTSTSTGIATGTTDVAASAEGTSTADNASTTTVSGTSDNNDSVNDSVETTTGDASAAATASNTDTETGEVTLTVPAAGENASEGQLITPTGGADTQDASSSDTAVAGAATVDGTAVDGTVDDTATTATTTETEATTGTEATDGFVMLSVSTEPAGAEVSIDNFFLGTTPQVDFPVTPGADKLLRVSLDGYETIERTFDGTEEQDFFFTLNEASAGSGEAEDVEGDATTLDSIAITSDGTVLAIDDPSLEPAAELQGKAVITVENGGEAWLEVYQGTSRNGATLVYQVATDSDRFEFDLPVFVRAGRSSLVKVSINGGLANPLGPPDQVAEQLFEE